MAPAGVVAHSSSWTRAVFEPHEVLLFRLFGVRQVDRSFRSTRALPPISERLDVLPSSSTGPELPDGFPIFAVQC